MFEMVNEFKTMQKQTTAETRNAYTLPLAGRAHRQGRPAARARTSHQGR